MLKKINENRIVFYLGIMTLLTVIFYVLCIVNNECRMAVFHNDPYDTFMDYFNCLVRIGNPVGRNIYSRGTTMEYPPIAVLVFRILNLAARQDVAGKYGKDMRMFQSGLMGFTIFVMIVLCIIVFSIAPKLKFGKLTNSLFVIVLFFNTPAIFAIERGNIVILAFALTAFFVAFCDDESKVLRELSYIALALAASIKLYPAVFGFLIVSRNRYKDAIRLAIYGFIMFFVPFIPYGGLKAVYEYLRYITGHSDMMLQTGGAFATGLVYNGELNKNFLSAVEPVGRTIMNDSYASNYSLINILQVLEEMLGIHFSVQTNKILLVVCVIVLFAASFVVKNKWEKILCYGLLVVFIPSSSPTYAAVFILPAFFEFVLYMDKKEDFKAFGYEWLMGIVLAAFLIPWAFGKIPYFDTGAQNRVMHYSYLVYYLLLVYMTVMLFYKAVSSFIQKQIVNKVVRYTLCLLTCCSTILILIRSVG